MLVMRNHKLSKYDVGFEKSVKSQTKLKYNACIETKYFDGKCKKKSTWFTPQFVEVLSTSTCHNHMNKPSGDWVPAGSLC